MTPDKIYIDNRGNYVEFPVFPQADANVEYIRKDTLLEWLQKEYETNKWFYETHAKPNELHTGRCEAYKQVIDKLKAM